MDDRNSKILCWRRVSPVSTSGLLLLQEESYGLTTIQKEYMQIKGVHVDDCIAQEDACHQDIVGRPPVVVGCPELDKQWNSLLKNEKNIYI